MGLKSNSSRLLHEWQTEEKSRWDQKASQCSIRSNYPQLETLIKQIERTFA